MLVTEDQARTMACPLTLQNGEGRERGCQRALCMAWRVAGKKAGVEVGYCGMAGMPSALTVALRRDQGGGDRRILTFDE